ncbi:hypothetical protein HK102_010426 [Quaeritorhiza haematococci]|nr:hypothetical protein HK102_010426 [Quaeritorhiza haematococci]
MFVFTLFRVILGVLLLRAQRADGLLIHGYNATGHEVFAVEKDQPPKHLSLDILDTVTLYTVGNGPKDMEIWMPDGYDWTSDYDSKGFIFACALHDIVARSPDITGKASSRHYKGELEPLEKYFAKYAKDTGRNIIDEFYKGVYYDYKIGESWIGVPLEMDVRVLYYNKTLLKDLNLKEPPPTTSWGEYDAEWTWDKFLEYAGIIKNSGQKNGFRMYSLIHEESHNLQPGIGRLVNAPLVESDGTCGLRTRAWYDAIEKYIRRPLQEGILELDYIDANIDASPPFRKFLQDKNPQSDILSQVDVLASSLFLPANWKAPVMDTMSLVSAYFLYPVWLRNPNETGYAYPPGSFSFLGGIGIVIPKHAKNKWTAWEYIAHLTKRTESFVRRLNINGGVIPPFESFAELPAFSSPFLDFSKKLIRRAVPDHYPGSPYRRYKEVEALVPFRLMMMEMKYKNFSAEVATNRTCQVVEFIFQRDCDQTDYEPVISNCLLNNTKTLSYVWKTPQSCKMGTVTLPPPVYNIDCSYVVRTSNMAMGVDVVTAIGMTLSLFYAIGFLLYRERPAIKAASLVFCQVIFLGSMILYASVFLQAGQPSVSLCHARPWFLAVGFGLLLGGLLVKMVQISEIFSAQLSAKHFDKNRFSLLRMLQNLVVIILFEVGALVALSIVGSPGIIEKRIEIRGVGSYSQRECAPFDQITIVILIGINAVLIIYGSYTAWKSRKVPDAFNETKFVVVAILLISFTAVVILPVVTTVGSVASQYLLVSLAINFATTVSMAIFAIPKLHAAYYNIKAKVSTFGSSTVNSNPPVKGGPDAKIGADQGNTRRLVSSDAIGNSSKPTLNSTSDA